MSNSMHTQTDKVLNYQNETRHETICMHILKLKQANENLKKVDEQVSASIANMKTTEYK